MTEPQPVMAQAEQDQLTRQVGRALLTVAGADWQQVRAEYRAAGRHIEVDVVVTGPDGVERPARPPQEVVDGLGRLRRGMYRPGRGTWLSALYVLDPPSSFSAEFEPDVEPRWRRVPPPIGFADELRFFPRGDEHLPDWLRQRAGLPPTQGEPNGPGGPLPGGPAPGQPPHTGPHTPASGQPSFAGPNTPAPGQPPHAGPHTPAPGQPPFAGPTTPPPGRVPTPPPGIPHAGHTPPRGMNPTGQNTGQNTGWGPSAR